MDFPAFLPLWSWVLVLAASALGLGVGMRLIRGDMAIKPKSTSGFKPTLNLKGIKLSTTEPAGKLEPEVEKGEGTADLVQLAKDLKKWKQEQ